MFERFILSYFLFLDARNFKTSGSILADSNIYSDISSLDSRKTTFSYKRLGLSVLDISI